MYKALFCCANSTCQNSFSVRLTESNSYQEYQTKLAKLIPSDFVRKEQTHYDKKGKIIRISRTLYCKNCAIKNKN